MLLAGDFVFKSKEVGDTMYFVQHGHRPPGEDAVKTLFSERRTPLKDPQDDSSDARMSVQVRPDLL